MRSFQSLCEQEILAMAIALEEEDARVSGDFAEGLTADAPTAATVLKEMQACQAVVDRLGAEPAQVAIDWLLSQPAVSAPIIDATKMAHLEVTLAGVDLSSATRKSSSSNRPISRMPCADSISNSGI